MKKLNFLVKTFSLITLLFLSGCISNEETDGVKALREAQASLIQARADKESALIQAEVAFREAEAALKQAEADIKIADARKKDAQTDYEIGVINAETKAKIDKAVADAENALAISQKNLEASLRALEAEIAKSMVDNPTLDEYLNKYANSIWNIEGLQGMIINKQKQINTKTIDLVFEGASQALLNSLSRNQNKLEKAQDKYEKYASANDDPTSVFADVNSAEVAAKNIADDLTRANEKLAELNADLAKKATVMGDLSKEYADIDAFLDTIDLFTNDLTFTKKISAVDLAKLTNNPASVSETFKSIPKYDEDIDKKQEAIDDLGVKKSNASLVLSSLRALYNAYRSALTQAQTARDNSLASYRTAVQNYNIALLANASDPGAPDVVSKQTVRDNALIAYNDKNADLTNLKNDIRAVALDFGLSGDSEWDDKFYSWAAADKNDEKIEELIEKIEETDIPKIDEDTEKAEEELEELKEDRSIVVAYIALLKSDYKATETNLTSIKNEYQSAKDAWTVATKAKEDQSDLIADITLEKVLVEAVKDALLGDYNRIVTELEALEDALSGLIIAIENDQKQIDSKNITDVEYLEGEIEVLNLELKNLQQELIVEQKLATYYLSVINELLAS